MDKSKAYMPSSDFAAFIPVRTGVITSAILLQSAGLRRRRVSISLTRIDSQ
jgi:hypothetical protein